MKASRILAACTIAIALVLSGCLVGCGSTPFKLNESSVEMEQYEEFQLTANKSGDIVWMSSDPRTVRVEDGKLTSLKLGDATITATLGDETATCEVTVRASTKGRALGVDQEEVTVPLNESVTVTATLRENGTPLEAPLTWTSNKPAVATVTNGEIHGVSSGDAKITVSTTYKGQAFSKEIAVTVYDNRHQNVSFALKSASPDGTLVAYTGSMSDIGFADGSTVQTWTSVTKDGSAVWPADVDRSKGDRLVFDIVLKDSADVLPVVDNGGITVEGCGTVAGVRIASVLYFNADGDLVETMEADTLYTGVIDLRKGTGDTYALALNGAATAYIGNAVICSNEYYLAQYDHRMPAEPITDGVWIAKLEGPTVGQPFNEIGGKQTEGKYAGMYKVPCMTDIWGERLGPATEAMLGYSGLPALHNIYRQYDYFGFDLVIENSVPDLTVWTGGYAIFVRASGLGAEGGNTIKPDDIAIYDPAGRNVAGEALQPDTCYTFKIRIQKDNTDNAAFGIAVPGEATQFFYIGTPWFLTA